MKLNFGFLLCICMAASTSTFAQTKNIKSVTVTNYDEPYNLIVVAKDDIGDMSLVVDSSVAIKNRKGKVVSQEEVEEGLEVNIYYEERGGKRVVTGIELVGEVDEGKRKFTGLFEGSDGEVAFIDGRKVKLGKNASFKGVKKGDGKINIDFINFQDDLLKRGYYMTVKGHMQADGIILADEILVRKNVATKEDVALIGQVNQGFNGNGLNRLQVVPAGIYNAANGLYNGNIAIGGVSYKLSPDIKLQGYINEVGYKLIPPYTNDPAWQKENQKIDFRFYVVEDQLPNAFAWPNGMVFIHTGLLKIIENEAQLAFVLSHEISHVLYEHGSARFKKSEHIKDAVGLGKGILEKGGKILGGVGHVSSLLGRSKATANPAPAAGNAEYEYYTMMQKLYGFENAAGSSASNGVVADKGVSVVLSKIGSKLTPDALSGLFGKDQEDQADRVGMYYTQLAGYDVREVPKLWSKMMERNSDPTFLGNMASGFKSLLQSSSFDISLTGDLKSQLLNSPTDMLLNNVFKSVYSSHPLTQNRLKNANQLLASTYQKKSYADAKTKLEEYTNYVNSLK